MRADRLLGLLLGLAVAAAAPARPLHAADECDELETCSIDNPTRSCLFPVTVADQAMLQITVNETSGSLAARWRLLTKAGTPASSCGDFKTATAVDCGPLAAGEYRVEVSGTSGTGTAAVHVESLTGCESPQLECDVPASGELTAGVDTDLFRFTVADHEILRLTVRELTDGLRAEWRVLTAQGTPASACGTFQSSLSADCGPFLAGDYQLQVRDELFTGTGAYAVHLLRLTATQACDSTPVGCDQLVNAAIDPGIDQDLFRFSLPDIGRARVTVDDRGGTLKAEWRLLTAAGAPAAFCGTLTTGRSVECGPLAAGDYQIHVKDDVSKGIGRYDVSVELVGRACPACGNGVLDGLEQCDPPGGCCTTACRFASSDTVCRPEAGPCDLEEKCSGRDATCPADEFRRPQRICRAASGPCDLPETCTGSSVACPPPDSRRAPDCRVCSTPGDCDDGDPCTDEVCTEAGECGASLPLEGFDGASCELGKLLEAPLCESGPVDRNLARLIARKVAAARRALDLATKTGRPRRRARLLKRTDHLLAAVERRVAHDRKIPAACGAVIGQLVAARRQQIAGLSS